MRFLIASVSLLFSIQLYAQNYQQTLMIGALPFNTPFTTEVDIRGHFVGFDISLMDEICKRINMKCLYKRATITELFSAVKRRELDLAIGGLIITRQRQETFLFSMPYLMSYGSFVVLNNSKYNRIYDLTNKRIGVLKGSVYERLVQERFGSSVTLVTYPLMPDILSVLVNKRVDAILIDKEPALYWASKETNLKILGQPIQTGSGYAVMTNQDNIELIKSINSALLEMEQDGTYIKLYNDFFN